MKVRLSFLGLAEFSVKSQDEFWMTVDAEGPLARVVGDQWKTKRFLTVTAI